MDVWKPPAKQNKIIRICSKIRHITNIIRNQSTYITVVVPMNIIKVKIPTLVSSKLQIFFVLLSLGLPHA